MKFYFWKYIGSPGKGVQQQSSSGERCPRPGYYPLPGPVPVSLTFSRGHRCQGCCARQPRQTRRPPACSAHFVSGWVASIDLH